MIVVLDGYTLNPGDLDWQPLKELGKVTIYDRTPPEKVAERCEGADIVLTNKALLLRDQLDRMPDVKYIGVMATGYNVVDVEEAKRRGIRVTNVAGYSTESVVQHVFALILGLINKVEKYDKTVKAGDWSKSEDFSYWSGSISEISGKTLGIIGYGTIGKRVAEVARAFGMQVIHASVKEEASEDELNNLFRSADIISLHCPLTPQNKGFVNKDKLALMKKEAILINTARGPLINHTDLFDFLKDGRIKGAGLDVFDQEPPVQSHPIFSLENCLITPHQAWATIESRQRLLNEVVENIKAYQRGEKWNVIV